MRDLVSTGLNHIDLRVKEFFTQADAVKDANGTAANATAATLTLPPAIVARMAATIDSIAPGRFGINLVTGWAEAEYSQMGLWPGEEHFKHRYEMVTEYVTVMKELWETGHSDFKGSYFTMNDCRLSPLPSRPIKLISAGTSDAVSESPSADSAGAGAAKPEVSASAPEGAARPPCCGPAQRAKPPVTQALR